MDKKRIWERVRATPYDPDALKAEALRTLKGDLGTRFIFSTNLWSKGRNSGLLECCNIIDEYLNKGDHP